jgi:hypothetical protein
VRFTGGTLPIRVRIHQKKTRDLGQEEVARAGERISR